MDVSFCKSRLERIRDTDKILFTMYIVSVTLGSLVNEIFGLS